MIISQSSMLQWITNWQDIVPPDPPLDPAGSASAAMTSGRVPALLVDPPNFSAENVILTIPMAGISIAQSSSLEWQRWMLKMC